MMKFAKITDGVVEQVQPHDAPGFTLVPDNTIPGMLDNGNGTFSNPPSSPAPVVPEEQDISLIVDLLINGTIGTAAEKAAAATSLQRIKGKRGQNEPE